MVYHIAFEDIAASALSHIMRRKDRRSVSFNEIRRYCAHLSRIVESRTGDTVELDLDEDIIEDFLDEYKNLFTDAAVDGRDGIRACNGVTRRILMTEFQGYLPPCVEDAIEILDRDELEYVI